MNAAQAIQLISALLEVVLKLLPNDASKVDLLKKLELRAQAKRRTLERANERLGRQR